RPRGKQWSEVVRVLRNGRTGRLESIARSHLDHLGFCTCPSFSSIRRNGSSPEPWVGRGNAPFSCRQWERGVSPTSSWKKPRWKPWRPVSKNYWKRYTVVLARHRTMWHRPRTTARWSNPSSRTFGWGPWLWAGTPRTRV